MDWSWPASISMWYYQDGFESPYPGIKDESTMEHDWLSVMWALFAINANDEDK